MGKVAHGYIFLMILKRVQKVKLNKALIPNELMLINFLRSVCTRLIRKKIPGEFIDA